ncbi:hypothetical protein UCRPC4_g01348 [Phaeomoniella chlamydospora]|uniref:Uncharacterized protein n=1 Tax=Phaeomoniella chlamydospora TaxID=158046 RepID=A0A0G2EY57_PHACM|nr:hypothetical protein UCRPC4_g01348 [Phaeomoniella chlamydospora]
MQTIEWYARGAGVLGALLWWRGRKTFKFPMWQAPKDPSVYNVFPTKRMPILTGARARYAWYAQRFTLYMALAVPLGIVIGNSAGTMTQVEGMKTDIRTQELIRQMRQRSHERQRIGQNPPTTESETNGTPYGQMQSDQGFDGSTMSSETERQGSETRIDRIKDSSRDFGGENTRDPYSFPRDTSGSNDRDRYSGSFSSTSSDSSSSFWDDASPTASDELGPSTSTISSDSGSVWDRLRQQTISTSRQESSSSETQSHTPTNPWNASDTSSSQSFQTSTTQSPGSNGSSWQRIRQGQSPVSFQQSRTQDDNNNNNNNNESYSFSSSDEDRALAKEQAQKDFDEMIERERKGGQGGNDDSGGGEGKGWWGKR